MEFKNILTTCPYCAVGCNMVLQVLDGEVVGTLPAKTGPSNEGRLCIKGWTVHEFIQFQDRRGICHKPLKILLNPPLEKGDCLKTFYKYCSQMNVIIFTTQHWLFQ